MASPSDNQAKAPQCAKFVKAMRDVFGHGKDEVKVLMVSEGDFFLGPIVDEKDVEVFATCFITSENTGRRKRDADKN